MPQTTLPPPDVPSNGTAIAPARPVPLDRPVLSGGGYWGAPTLTETLTRFRTQYECKYGDELYDIMRKDPIAGGSLKVLRSFTLARSLQLLPNRRPRAGEKVEDPRLQEAYDASARIADYCQWVHEKMDRPVDDLLRQFCEDSWSYGNKLADIVWTSVPRGDYEGQLPAIGPRIQTIEGIDPKPRRSWAFVVDPIRRIPRAIRGATAGKQEIYSVDKFAIATWEPADSSPVGSSIFEMAVPAWYYRVNMMPEAFKFGQRFGTPAPYGYLDNQDGQLDIYKKRDEFGGLSVAEFFLGKLLEWRNGQAFVGRKGDEIGLKEPSGDGSAIWNAIDKWRVETVLAILFQVGATQESQFDSRAKSETSMDVLGNIINYLKRWTCNFWTWQVLYKIVWFNFGKRFADLYTPIASLGDTDASDTNGLLTALSRVGYRLTASQLPELDAMAGVPIRQPGEATIPVAGAVAAPAGDQNDQGDNEGKGKEAA